MLEHVVGDDVDAQVFFASKDGGQGHRRGIRDSAGPGRRWDILIAALSIEPE
jgi:hypothetical protein